MPPAERKKLERKHALRQGLGEVLVTRFGGAEIKNQNWGLIPIETYNYQPLIIVTPLEFVPSDEIECGWVYAPYATAVGTLWLPNSVPPRVSNPNDAWLGIYSTDGETYTFDTSFHVNSDPSRAFTGTARKEFLGAWAVGHTLREWLVAPTNTVTAAQSGLLDVMQRAVLGHVGRPYGGAVDAALFAYPLATATYGIRRVTAGQDSADAQYQWLLIDKSGLRYQPVVLSTRSIELLAIRAELIAAGKSVEARQAEAWALAMVTAGPELGGWTWASGSWWTDGIPGDCLCYGWHWDRKGDKAIICTHTEVPDEAWEDGRPKWLEASIFEVSISESGSGALSASVSRPVTGEFTPSIPYCRLWRPFRDVGGVLIHIDAISYAYTQSRAQTSPLYAWFDPQSDDLCYARYYVADGESGVDKETQLRGQFANAFGGGTHTAEAYGGKITLGIQVLVGGTVVVSVDGVNGSSYRKIKEVITVGTMTLGPRNCVGANNWAPSNGDPSDAENLNQFDGWDINNYQYCTKMNQRENYGLITREFWDEQGSATSHQSALMIAAGSSSAVYVSGLSYKPPIYGDYNTETYGRCFELYVSASDLCRCEVGSPPTYYKTSGTAKSKIPLPDFDNSLGRYKKTRSYAPAELAIVGDNSPYGGPTDKDSYETDSPGWKRAQEYLVSGSIVKELFDDAWDPADPNDGDVYSGPVGGTGGVISYELPYAEIITSPYTAESVYTLGLIDSRARDQDAWLSDGYGAGGIWVGVY